LSSSSSYHEKVKEALSKALSKMEPYETTTTTTTTTIANQSTTKDVFRPHVELGTAPIEVDHIEDIQKIRPFHNSIGSSKTSSSIYGGTPSSTASFSTTASKSSNFNINSKKFGARKSIVRSNDNVTSSATAAAAAAAATTIAAVTKNDDGGATTTLNKKKKVKESCMIESTCNSVRISFLFKQQAQQQQQQALSLDSGGGDPLEVSILFQWMRFLTQQAEDHYQILRKKPLEGYSVSFLITNKHISIHGQQKLQQTIVNFCSQMDKECSDIKIQVNAQARYITTEFLKAFNE
jgi:hypothetical protein